MTDTGQAPGPAVAAREAGEGLFDLGPAASFADESITRVVAGGQELVLIRHEGEFFALPDQCTHQRYPLHDGELIPGKIRCVHHGATFDLHSGRPTLPAVKKIRLFQAFEREGRVYVSLQER
ncbi:MAG TPA: Rieske 2Fe-2S domain-containing protein [Trueperaceae bacterium]